MDSPAVTAYVGVGSNVDPERNVPAALELLGEVAAARLTGVSTFYRTEPLGGPEGRVFLNGVVRIETELGPRRMKAELLGVIETRLGRVRTGDRYAPREIDLDLLLHGDLVVSEPGLVLPHPDVRARGFVAVPLLELSPGLVLPDGGESLTEAAARIGRQAMAPDHEFTRALKERFRQ